MLSRTFAIRGGYRVDANQELVALGAANVAAGFFQGFSVSSSSSRTPVAEAAGAKTQVTGLVGALFFANAEVFADRLRQAIASSPTPVRWAVVAAEPVTDLDTTAADVLRELDEELAAEGVDLRFAEMKDPVKDRLKRYALYERFGDDHFYPTIGAAVNAYPRHDGDRMERLGGSLSTHAPRIRVIARDPPHRAGSCVMRRQPKAIPSAEADGVISGRRNIRNELNNPARAARIGMSNAT